MSFIGRVIVNALAIWLTTLLFGSHVKVVGGDSTLSVIAVYLGVAFIFAIVATVIKPVMQIIALPLYVLTLGLFHLVINAAVLLLVSWVTSGQSWGLHIDGFWWAVLAGCVLSLLNTILTSLFTASAVGGSRGRLLP